MEAAEVLGMPPGFKFNPNDDELMEFYLVPRLLGQQLPLDGVILEDDPRSAPPLTLLDRHGRKVEAFFFASGQSVNGKGSPHQKRTCTGGGCWQGQKTVVNSERLRVRGSGMEIRWRKYMLNFHADGDKKSSGWVMHEYSVTSPPELASSPLRLYHIRLGVQGKNKRKRGTQDSGGDQGAAVRRAMATDPDLLDEQEKHPSTSRSVFPPVVAPDQLGASAEPALTTFSSDHASSGVTNDLPLPDHFLPDDTDDIFGSLGDIVLPDLWFRPGAESSEQDNPAAGATDEFPFA